MLQIHAYRRLLYIDKYASDEAHRSAGCRQRFSGRRVQQSVTNLTPAARRTPFLAWFFWDLQLVQLVQTIERFVR